MSYITTVTGKHFDPVHVDVDKIDILDIAHALSQLCRANGHTKYFYSVAQHSINCCREAAAKGYSEKVQYACLLHDAAEAYLSDVTRPVKALLEDYQVIEEKLLWQIWKKYLHADLTDEEYREVFEIDDQMLSYEFTKLLPESVSDDYKEITSSPDVTCKDPSSVETEFLERCRYFNAHLI